MLLYLLSTVTDQGAEGCRISGSSLRQLLGGMVPAWGCVKVNGGSGFKA